jgi:hypothetical protein
LYPNTGEGPVTALATFIDSVLTFFKSTIYRYRGVEPSDNGNWNQLPIKQGTIAPRSICLTSNTLTFLGNGGIYAIPPSVLNITGNVVLSNNLIPNIADKKVSKKIKKLVHPETVCACWDASNEMLLLAVCDIEGDTTDANNKIIAMDWNKRAFSWWQGMNIYDMAYRIDKTILWGTDNYLAKYGVGYRDVGDVPIYGKLMTRQYDCGAPINIKKFLKAYVAALQLPEWTYHLSLNVRCGYTYYNLTDVSLDESFDWGKDWGLIWGHIDIITLEYKLKKVSGHRVQFTFENNVLDEPMATYGIAVKRRLKRTKGTTKIS